MGIYAHKDIVFEARQLLYNTIDDIKEWAGAKYTMGEGTTIVGLYIKSDNLISLARMTDYIMKGYDKFVIIPQDIFENQFMKLYPNKEIVELLDEQFDDDQELPDLVKTENGQYLRWDQDFYYYNDNPSSC